MKARLHNSAKSEAMWPLNRSVPAVAMALAALLGCASPPPPGAPQEASYGDRRLPATAVVLGMSVHTRDVDELRYVVQKRLSDRFARAQGITVSGEEVSAYIRHVDAALERDGIRQAGPTTAEDRTARQQIASAFILQWKINRALYQRYGGRIGYQQGGPEPLDAWRRFLEDGRAQGDFRLLDPAMEEPFWRYFIADGIHSFYPRGSAEEARAFGTPPWEAAR